MEISKERAVDMYILGVVYIIIAIVYVGGSYLLIVPFAEGVWEKFIFYYCAFPCILLPFCMFLIERYFLYEDRFVLRTMFFITNIVYFDDLIQIKELIDVGGKVYIFDDGRKDNKYDGLYTKSGRRKYNNNFGYGIKYNIKVKKCKELEEFINEKLDVPIVKYYIDGEKWDND